MAKMFTQEEESIFFVSGVCMCIYIYTHYSLIQIKVTDRQKKTKRKSHFVQCVSVQGSECCFYECLAQGSKFPSLVLMSSVVFDRNRNQIKYLLKEKKLSLINLNN